MDCGSRMASITTSLYKYITTFYRETRTTLRTLIDETWRVIVVEGTESLKFLSCTRAPRPDVPWRLRSARCGSHSAHVLLDEAHRHAPSGRLEEDSESDRLRSLLRRAVRETRKYGIGWFFISQTLGGIDNEILQQLRILAFGFGLAMGTELDRLRDFAGGDKRALELYQSFRDPQSFPSKKLQEFPFMAVGPGLR
jgi:hypothetical protein